MKILKLTKKDFLKKKGEIYSSYIGKTDLSNFKGSLEIAENIGVAFFKCLRVSGYISAKAGTGIEAGTGIKAGLSIHCNLDIKFTTKLFAGAALWNKENSDDKKIVCGSLKGGVVCYGDVSDLIKGTQLENIKDRDLKGRIKRSKKGTYVSVV